MRAGLAAIAVAVLAATVLAGCIGGGGSRDAEPDDGAAPAAGPATGADEPAPSTTATRPATLEGRVTNRDGPLAGANVTLKGPDVRATTDADGAFRFDGLPGGTFELETKALGHETARMAVTLRPGETVTTDIALKPLDALANRKEMWTFEGWFVCSVGAATAVRCPGANLQTAPQAGNRVEFNLTLRESGFESLVLEVRWEPRTSSLNGVCVEVLKNGRNDHDVCGAGGLLTWRTEKDDDPSLAPQGGKDANLILDFWAGWEDAAGNVAANVQAAQAFTVHAHVFYGQAAPEAYVPSEHAS